MTEKLCPRCQTVKSAAQFYASKKRPGGLSSYCRECQVKDSKSRYSAHPRWRAPEGQKWCPGCQTTKPIESFGNNKKNRDGKQNYCKPCAVSKVTASRHKDPTSHRESSKRWAKANPERHADNNARWRYGVEHGAYAALLTKQNGRCAICGTTEPGGRANRFHFDHCHTIEQNEGRIHIRGLLCSCCNTGLGQMKHDKNVLLKAISYLDQPKVLP